MPRTPMSAMRRQLHYLPASFCWFDGCRRIAPDELGSRGRGNNTNQIDSVWQHGGNAVQWQCRFGTANKSASLPRLGGMAVQLFNFRAW